MLRACLDSLGAQILPVGMDLHIVVVDNEEAAGNARGVAEFAENCRYPVHYVHEPVRGIARARNAALDKAVALKADWICMLDDDETADHRWIANLMREEQHHFPILSGQRRFIYQGARSFWERERGVAADRDLTTASTCNIRFSRALIDAGLRFDEHLGLAGGEDSLFFRQAVAAGFRIGRAPEALTWEVRHPERMSYRGIMERAYTQNVGSQRQKILTHGRLRVCSRTLPKAIFELIAGAIILPASPLALLAGTRAFRTFALRGGKHIAKAFGSIAAAAGHLPQRYRHVVGH
jgi:succinoglycan biosynthesis protein ExoM